MALRRACRHSTCVDVAVASVASGQPGGAVVLPHFFDGVALESLRAARRIESVEAGSIVPEDLILDTAIGAAERGETKPLSEVLRDFEATEGFDLPLVTEPLVVHLK